MSNFFYSHEADQFAFYQIPKELFINPIYSKVCTDAKLLYGLLLDRNSLSRKNNWIDNKNIVYIFFSREEAMELLNCKKELITKLFKQLKDADLIEEVRQGLGKANVIYVKKFIRTGGNAEVSQKFENPTSGEPKNELPVFRKSNGSNTYFNNNKLNKSSSTTLTDDEISFSKYFEEKAKASINNKQLKLLLKKYLLEDLFYVLDRFLDKTKNQPLKNIAGAFIAYLNGDFTPAIKQDAKLSNQDNFTERKYDSSDFEKYYKRLDE